MITEHSSIFDAMQRLPLVVATVFIASLSCGRPEKMPATTSFVCPTTPATDAAATSLESTEDALDLPNKLVLAARAGRTAEIQSLLDRGANLNKVDARGELPLSVAVAMRNLELAKFLIERRADVNAFDGSHRTPLMDAEIPEMAEFLVAHGADIHALAEDGRTVYDIPEGAELASVWAVALKERPVVEAERAARERALIASLSDPEKLSRYFYTAVLRGNIPILEVLLSRHTFTDEINRALSSTHQLDVAKFLVAHGAKVNDAEEAPIAYASVGGYLEIVQWLLASGASANGWSKSYAAHALSLAAINGHAEVVKVLLAAGADRNVKDGYGTPLEAAKGRNHPEVVKILRDSKPRSK